MSNAESDELTESAGVVDANQATAETAAVPAAPPASGRITAALIHLFTWPSRMHPVLFFTLAALVAGLASLYFFCPRFVIWKSLDYEFGWFNPEVNRAVFTWRKVQDPFVFTTNNAPINWRFLFPIIAHYLYFPRLLFFAIPFIGCWITLGVVCHIAHRDTGSRRTAFLLTGIVATTSWYFVSTGWLAYFDSWYVLGMLGFAFFRSYWIVGAACLLTPWVDERFIIMLPLLMITRAVYFEWIPRRDWKSFLICSLLIGSLTGIYLTTRFVAHFWKLETATAYNLNEHMTGFQSHYLTRLGSGVWNGLRGAWLLVGMFMWYAWSRKMWAWNLLIWVTCTTNIFMILRFVQGDHSRTASVAVPLLILGAVYFVRRVGARADRVLFAVWIFNLLAPAEHVIATFSVPIRYFYTELDNYRGPPFFLSAEFYTQRGAALFQQQKFDEALKEFDVALQIDPKFNTARLNKAIILTLNKKYDEALIVLNEALTADADFPEAYYARGVCREAKLDYHGAVTDYKRALDAPKKDWPFRPEAERLYKKLRGVGINPR